MGLGTLVDRIQGYVSDASWWNSIHSILKGDFVGRDVTSGAPAAGQNLGTALYPWGVVYAQTAVVGGVPINASQLESASNKTVSGKVRASSNQAQFLSPAGGSSLNFTVLATATPLVLQIAGVAVTISADLGPAAMSAGPTATAPNQAVINDGTAIAQAPTRTWGEYAAPNNLTIGTVGANISAKVGQWCVFKLAGTTTEYLLAYVESATQLTRAFRGYFFDSTLAPVKRTTFSNGATLTLMNLGWVFLDANGTTIDISQSNTNNNPVFAALAPTSPTTNDYWFNTSTQAWTQWNGSGWIAKNRHLVGLVVADNSGCQVARSFDFWSLVRSDNTVELTVDSTTQIKTTGLFQYVNVMGKRNLFMTSRQTWNKTGTLAAATERYNAAVTASATEYCYITDTGQPLFSDMEPYWRADLFGWYHPYNPWRAVGYDATDGSGNFQSSTLQMYGAVQLPDTSISLSKLTTAALATLNPPGTCLSYAGTSVPSGYLACDGTQYATATYSALFAAIGYTWGGSGANFKVPDFRGRALIGSGTGAGLSARTLGTQNIGEETHLLTTAEMPSHSHTDAGHTHPQSVGGGIDTDNSIATTSSGSTGSPPATATGYANLSNTGGGGAHNNMQPSAVITWIIKT